MAEQNEKPSYLDENLDEEEKHGHTRLPMPEEEGRGEGKTSGKEREPMRPDRADDAGDGDRRS